MLARGKFDPELNDEDRAEMAVLRQHMEQLRIELRLDSRFVPEGHLGEEAGVLEPDPVKENFALKHPRCCCCFAGGFHPKGKYASLRRLTEENFADASVPVDLRHVCSHQASVKDRGMNGSRENVPVTAQRWLSNESTPAWPDFRLPPPREETSSPMSVGGTMEYTESPPLSLVTACDSADSGDDPVIGVPAAPDPAPDLESAASVTSLTSRISGDSAYATSSPPADSLASEPSSPENELATQNLQSSPSLPSRDVSLSASSEGTSPPAPRSRARYCNRQRDRKWRDSRDLIPFNLESSKDSAVAVTVPVDPFFKIEKVRASPLVGFSTPLKDRTNLEATHSSHANAPTHAIRLQTNAPPGNPHAFATNYFGRPIFPLRQHTIFHHYHLDPNIPHPALMLQPPPPPPQHQPPPHPLHSLFAPPLAPPLIPFSLTSTPPPPVIHHQYNQQPQPQNIFMMPSYGEDSLGANQTVQSATSSQSSADVSKKDRCAFCKSNGERETVYLSHALRDSDTQVVLCPQLRKFKCPICGATGDHAHTQSYCPKNTSVVNKVSPNRTVKHLKALRPSAGKMRAALSNKK